jgi:glycosyltransferase involved in cell wall biosynthesis
MRRGGRLACELADAGVPLREYPIRSLCSPGAVWQLLRLARHMSRRQIQIVHAYNFYGNAFAIPAAWLAGVPVIIASIRDRGVYLSDGQRHLQRLVCRLADCVLVNADSIKEWLVSDGYDRSKIAVIRNGIDLDRFDGVRRSDLRAEFGIPPGVPVITMLSRLNPQKGVEDFVDAAAIVAWQFPDARFLIVGEGELSRVTRSEDQAYRRKLINRGIRLGLRDRLILTGYRADVPALLADTTISVLPSHSEGLSNSILESMAAGVPVVATRVGGTPEAIEHGVTGLLAPPNDPQELATWIGRLLFDRDLASKIGAAGRQSVRDRFGMDRMVHATEQLYLDLLVHKAAAPGWRGRLGLARPALQTWAGKNS